MKRRLILPALSILAFTIASQSTLAASAVNVVRSPEVSIAPMLKQAMPAVVNIRVSGTLPVIFPNPRSPDGVERDNSEFTNIGSGVIINAKEGLIVTNAHVIRDGTRIIVTLQDGRNFTAKKIGSDQNTDIALLRIDANNLKAMKLGNSANLQVGDFVAAIGSPFGLKESVTSGIVSGLDRSSVLFRGSMPLIQTDAPINPGNSGGALTNAAGEMIGMNTAIISPERGNVGIGFAIPSNEIKKVVAQLLRFGKVKRGMLGVLAQDLTPELATGFAIQDTQKGALISRVSADSPAAQAGLRVGDVITAVNNQPIHTAGNLVAAVSLLPAGSTVNITYLNHSQLKTTKVTTTDPEKLAQQNETANPFFYDVSLEPVQFQDQNDTLIKGIKVIGMSKDSAAFHAGLRTGDIMISANHAEIPTLRDLRQVASRAKDVLAVNIVRPNRPGALFIALKRFTSPQDQKDT